jgi:FSR family fosmidomycin resistance protein-like MFS transporter
MNPSYLLLLIAAHLVTDTAQGALPALLPLLKENLGLSYALAGVIIMTMNLTSSVIQPIFGYLTDRWSLRWLLPLGVAASGLGLALVALAPGYWGVLGAVVFSGLGVASYHPEAFKSVLASAGERKVTAVSWFMVGGNLGMALGPVLVSAYLAWLGLSGVMIFALPASVAALMFLLVWRAGARGQSPQAKAAPAITPQPLGERWRPLAVLISAVVLRSWVQTGLMAYLPFYYVQELGGDPLEVGHLLSALLLSGVAGTLLGAQVAERTGPKPFFVATVALVTPLAVWCLYAQGVWFFVAVGLTGAFLASTWSVVMVMAQQILPDRAGMASGMMVGFAIGTGGVGAAVLGMLADSWGVPLVMWIIAVLPVASAAVGALLRLPGAAEPPARD